MNNALGRSSLAGLLAIAVVTLSIACAPEAGAPLPVTVTEPSTAVVASAEGLDQTTQAPATTARLESGSMGAFNLSPIPQTVPGETTPATGGLTVSAIGSTTMAADEAYVVVIPERFYGPSGPEQLSADDRNEIIEALAEVGVPEEAIEFEHRGRYGESSISVELEPSEIAERSEAILDAVEEVVR